MKTKAKFESIICCPNCRGKISRQLTGIICDHCSKEYKEIDGVFFFNEIYKNHNRDSEFQLEQMEGESLTAKLFNIGSSIINSEYNPAKDLSKFMAIVSEDAVIVEFGSGHRRLSNNIINLDLFPFQNVDFVTNIVNTPFKDSSVDYIILDTVLEHVPDPQEVVDEIFRILKKRGMIFNVTPLLFPYHGYPKHYYNFTEDGLDHLFRNFTDIEISTNIGPSAALTNLVSEYFSLILSGNNKFFYTLFKGASLLPIFVFKYLDFFIYKKDFSKRIASTLSLVARK